MLTEIMVATDRKAALCGLGDDELDRCCAELQGWSQADGEMPIGIGFGGDVQFGDIPYWIRSDSSSIVVGDYTPSRDLNQAYELLFYVDMTISEECVTWNADSIDGKRYWQWMQSFPDGGRILAIGRVTLPEAKSHSRAVAILACLALMEGME